MSEDIEWVGINDNQEKMVKKESLYFFKNKWGDYLAIFKDHIEIKVSNKKNEWQDFEAYIPLQGTTVKIHAGDQPSQTTFWRWQCLSNFCI